VEVEMKGDDLPADAIDLGHDTFYTKKIDDDSKWVGLYEWHKCDKREYYNAGCIRFVLPDAESGYVRSSDYGIAWDVISLEPLTLSPSLACGTCGHHGWIRDGKWVPA
jgi:hypothetical protein